MSFCKLSQTWQKQLLNFPVPSTTFPNKFDKLENRFDKLENFVIVQFDVVQEGIAYNSAKFDRLEAKFFDARSDIVNMPADLKELTQAVRKKEFV